MRTISTVLMCLFLCGGGGSARADAALDRAFATAIGPGAPGGVVLVLRHGRVVAKKAYGLASVELGTAMKVDDRFRIASISKQLTAVAVLQLVDEGKVDLAAPIGQYLTGTPRAWAKVTIAELLSHTSGIVTRADAPAAVTAALDRATTLAELRKILDAQPLGAFGPGTRHVYNNWGYSLLAQLLETESGRTYCDYVAERLLRPLGMTHTECADTHAVVAGLVTGYGRSASHALIRPDDFPLNAPAAAAGGWVSTVDDLAKWALALHGGKLLKPATYAQLIAPTVLPGGEVVPYGFGTRLRTVDGRPIVAANGDVPGFHAEIAVDRAADCIAIALYNFQLYNFRAPYFYFSRRLLAFARGQPHVEPAVATDDLARYVGTYSGPDKVSPRRQVQLEGGKLYSKEEGDPGRDELVPLGHGLFRFGEDDDTRLTFASDHDVVTGVRISVDGSDDAGYAQTRQR
jgi:D-alanyl-D-alanine carboxypeptidase